MHAVRGRSAEPAPIVEKELRAEGTPLDGGTRSSMRVALGMDVGPVRIHTGPGADAAASAVGAKAFTAGHHIVFGPGHFAPSSADGRRLLAHELTHVVQQARPDGPPGTGVDPSSGHEREARAVGSAVAAGRTPARERPPASTGGTTRAARPRVIQRDPVTPAPAAGVTPPSPAPPTASGSPGAPAAAAVPGVAFVREEGLNLRSGPDQAASSLARMAFGSRVHLLEPESLHPGWQKVTTTGGAVGFLYAGQVHFPPGDLIARDPGVRMVRIRPGQTFWGLVKEQYGIQGNESTPDQNINHFINAIRAVNKSEAFIVDSGWWGDLWDWAISGRNASNTLLKANYDLWIPSFGVAATMDVGSGTVTGQISKWIKEIEQKLKDFRDAGAASGKYIPEAVARHAGEAAIGLLSGLVDFAKDAVEILAVSTAIGALVGALFGGVGAVPGAEIGFEIGMLILEAYGIAQLIETILGVAGQLVGKLASFVALAWQANGDPKKIDEAGKALAEALGILAAAALMAIAAYLLKKGGEALAKTKFAQRVGETQLAQWAADRAKRTTTRQTIESAGTPPPTPTPAPAPAPAPAPRSRGASASGVGDDFKVEHHPTTPDPVVETRPGTARPADPAPAQRNPATQSGGSTPSDVASIHDEATQGTGRGGRSPSDPEELNTSPDRRTVDPDEVDKMSPRYEGDRFDAKMTEEDLALVAQEVFPQYTYKPATKGKVVYRGGRPTTGRPKGSTVPDLYMRGRRARAGDPRLPPISLEAKNYFLGEAGAYEEFLSATAKQAKQRAAALPKSAQQHVVIDLRGQTPPTGFTDRLRADLEKASGGIIRADRVHFLTFGSQ